MWNYLSLPNFLNLKFLFCLKFHTHASCKTSLFFFMYCSSAHGTLFSTSFPWCWYLTKLGSVCPCIVKPIYWHLVMVKKKYSVYCRAPSKEYGKRIPKRPNLPDGFQGKVFKDRVRERVSVYLISSWTFFWLVGGEVIGSQHHQPSGPNWSGVYVLVVSMQLTSFTWRGF